MVSSYQTHCHGLNLWPSELMSSVYPCLHHALCLQESIFLSPNMIALCCCFQSFGYCGQSFHSRMNEMGYAFFAMFPTFKIEMDIDAGIVRFLNTSFATSLKDEYVIDPSLEGSASRTNVSAPFITRV